MPITLTGERRSFPGQARKGYINPSLFYDFTTGAAPTSLTYWRSSAGSRFNASGVLQSIPADTPRIDFNPVTRACRGLLVEPARSNFFLNNFVGSGGTIGTGTTTGPDGQPMRTFIVNAGSAVFPSFGGGSTSISLATGASQDIAFTGYFGPQVVGATSLEPLVVIHAGLDGAQLVYATAQINLSTWTIRTKGSSPQFTDVQAPTVTPMGGGVYKFTWVVRFTQDGTAARNSVSAYVQARDTASNGSYTADGLSGFQFACCQVELGSCPTSYIPTTTTPASRAPDIVFLGNLFPWFVNGEGTFVVELESMGTPSPSTWPGVSLLQFGGAARVGHVFNGGSGVPSSAVRTESGAVSFTPPPFSPAPSPGQVVRIAVAFKDGDFAACRDGGSLQTGASGEAPRLLDRLFLSQYDSPFNGWIQRVALYPYRVPNADLLTLTS